MRIVYCNALSALLILQATVIIEASDCVLCKILDHAKKHNPLLSANLSIKGGLQFSDGFESQSQGQHPALQDQNEDQHRAQGHVNVQLKIQHQRPDQNGITGNILNQPRPRQSELQNNLDGDATHETMHYPSSVPSVQQSFYIDGQRDLQQKTFFKQLKKNHFTQADIEIDRKLKTVELIKKYGYPVETHFVTTKDGYKLCMHRMPRPGAQPILLVHGLMSSSAAWVMMGPANGLAYILFQKGYDVWMLNTRGNIYSKEHTKKFIRLQEYWDFSFHDIGTNDVPSSIDLILERTNFQKIQYIGHSQGSTVFFVMCSELPEYSSKVMLMQALSPTVYMQQTRSPVLKFMSFFKGPLTILFEHLGGHEISLNTKLIHQFRNHICSVNEITSLICGVFDFVLCGFNWQGFNRTLTPIIVGHASQGGSTKQIHHYAQLHMSLYFRRYDHGPTKNLIRYHSISPPSYNLSQTQCRVVLHHGANDWLASGSDVTNLQQRLPNCIESRKVKLRSFTHFDFVISKDVRSLVYNRVVDLVATKKIQHKRLAQHGITENSHDFIIPNQQRPQWNQGQSDQQNNFYGDETQDILKYPNSDPSVQQSIDGQRNIPQGTFLIPPVQNHFTQPNIEIDGKLKTVELIKKYGYPVETHFVTTKDGYKLCMHRMPRPGAQPILLVHGLMSSSAAWVMMGPANGLAYILFQKGYDVWMLNTRGNIYSKEHTKKFISPKEYWDFSFHDIGTNDVPSSIDLILERTNFQKIQYIGHSQGSTVFFVMCSELPEYSSKVILMQALSPTVYMQQTRSPVLKFMSFFKGSLMTLLLQLGGYAISLSTKLIEQFRHHICPANEITSKICGMFDFVLCGFNWQGFNRTLTPIIVGHGSQGGSTMQIHHYAQLHMNLYFRRYDHGPTKNLIRYKSISPPSYNLSQTQCRVVLHHGANDWLASGSDVTNLQQRLPNCIESLKVKLRSFTHFDFVISKDVRSLVYNRVVDLVATKKIQHQRLAQHGITENSHDSFIPNQQRPQWNQGQSDQQNNFNGDETHDFMQYPNSDPSVQQSIYIGGQKDIQQETSFMSPVHEQIQHQRPAQHGITENSFYPFIPNLPRPQLSQGQYEQQNNFNDDATHDFMQYSNSDPSAQQSIYMGGERNLQQRTFLIPPLQNHFTQVDIEIDGKLKTVELIKKYGYPVDTHFVTTKDGYKLCMHRMPRPGAQPVLLVHGLMSSSAAWVMMGPANGLAYILFQKGYDVWMLNTRGNIYSKEHTKKFISPKEYWDFSFHDIGTNDVPSSIDLILERTNFQKIQYIGHSQGSTVFFVMCSELPEYSSKVMLMQALSPTVYMQQTRSPVLKFMSFFKGPLTTLLLQLGGYAISVSTKLIEQFRHHICPANEITSQICGMFDFVLCGFNWQGFNRTLTPIIVGHGSQGGSTMQIHHYAQLHMNLYFRRYDHGPTKNLIRYKSISPPSYNLSQTQCRVVLHHGANDWLASGSDVTNLQQRLPNCIESLKVKLESFTHFDFVISKDVRSLVYNRVVDLVATKKIQHQRLAQHGITENSHDSFIPNQQRPQWNQGQSDQQNNFYPNSDPSVQQSIDGQKNIPQGTFLIPPVQNHFTQPNIEIDGKLKTVELIKKYGYPVETHFVTTKDGYKLCMHRMPRPGAQPILLVHGLMSSSAAWVMMGPANGLAYILFQKGYDVWMLNTRGNIYSKEHTKKFISPKEYWDFSFHDIGTNDVPSSIDLILERTNFQKIQYIGHSQGSTVFFVMCSELPEYSSKVMLMQALSPTVYMQQTRSPVLKFMSFFKGPLTTLLLQLGGYAISASTKLIEQFRHHICPANEITSQICGMFDFVLCGFNWQGFNRTLTPIIVGHGSQGGSTMQIHHYAQLHMNLYFRRYDHGPTKNLIRYKSISPPSYNLSQTQCRVVLHHGANDWLASGSDVTNLQQRLPNCIESRKVKLESFTHFDFVISKDVRSLVYNRVVNLIVTNQKER